MEDTNFSKSHLLADEVDVDLDVLGTTVVDRVGCHVDSADVVAVDDCSNLQRDMEFLKKLPQLAALGDDLPPGTRPPHWTGIPWFAVWTTRTPGCLPRRHKSLM